MNDTDFNISDTDSDNCNNEESRPLHSSIMGIDIAMPEWEAILTVTVLTIIIVLTIFGNSIVVLSVFKYTPLRSVQNFFIVSLAVADLAVAIFVLPLNVVNTILGRWVFGKPTCTMWLTFDVLCCTASILNLCAIALDRYWAITDPLNYAQQRTLKRVLMMIGGVWILSGIISSPPVLGWNDWPAVHGNKTKCDLSRKQGYVVYSSLGSFYIPLFIMVILYLEIFIATKRRLRQRDRACRLNIFKKSISAQGPEKESVSSDGIHIETPENTDLKQSIKKRSKERRISQKGRRTSTKSIEKKTRSSMKFNFRLKLSSTSSNDCPSTPGLTSRAMSLKGSQTPTEENEGNVTPTSTCSVPVHKVVQGKQKISLSRERRAAKTLGIIMGVFIVCWLPFSFMYVIQPPFCPTCCLSDRARNFIVWLGYVNSALNPIIYTMFNLDFRRGFKKVLHIKV